MFRKGFEKTALDLARAARSGMKMMRNSTVTRNAAIGAGVGAIGGAASNSDNRFGGGIKGAVTGGLTGGLGTAAYKGFKTHQRFAGGFGQAAQGAKMKSMYSTHGQGD